MLQIGKLLDPNGVILDCLEGSQRGSEFKLSRSHGNRDPYTFFSRASLKEEI